MLALCLASPGGPKGASCAAAQLTGVHPARGGWMNQSHLNSLQRCRPPGIPDRCSSGHHAHHPPFTGQQCAPHEMQSIVAFERAATKATSVPFVSSLDTATSSAPHLPQVHRHAWESHASPSARAREDKCSPSTTFLVIWINLSHM